MAGEAYHRWTNVEKIRAPAATTVHLKQKVRIKSVIRELRAYMRDGGDVAKHVVRYEWAYHERVLQHVRRYRWRMKRSLKMKSIL